VQKIESMYVVCFENLEFLFGTYTHLLLNMVLYITSSFAIDVLEVFDFGLSFGQHDSMNEAVSFINSTF
jgi:hypothetical protein